MRQSRGRVVEIGSRSELDRRLGAGVRAMDGWRFTSLDLSAYGDALARADVAGATFLGCTFAPGDEASVERRGAIVFPTPPGSPVDPYRSTLYSPAELYDVPAYVDSYDARAYVWSQTAHDRDSLLARTLHDHAIDTALSDWVDGRRLLGVMGGHAVERGEEAYLAAALLGHAVGTELVVATGGGPGAMEAANLGAYLAGRPEAAVHQAVEELASAPSFRPSVDAWVQAAARVRAEHPDGRESLGIPTWHYGHEPSNPFATAVAKYFHNPTREAILLQLCEAGIVFLPGAAGTVQEIFQDACENYYADASSCAPMILVGRQHWTETVPAWPLLRALAQGRAMQDLVHLVDSVDEAVEVLRSRSTTAD